MPDDNKPCVPEVGEVWVRIHGNLTETRHVVSIDRCGPKGRWIYIVFRANNYQLRYNATPSQWRNWTKRAVRVDDKEAGR